MNKFFLLILLSTVLVGLYGQRLMYSNLTSIEFSQRIAEGNSTLLDVRTRSEFANGHIANAGQLNYYALDFRKKLLLLPKNQPVYIYCNTGWRSKRAAEVLAKHGYDQVYNLEKGIMDWDLQNLPVVREPDARADEKDKMEPDEFQALIDSDQPVLFDFYAPWCAPCRKMMPLLDSLQLEYRHKVRIVKINADASKKLVKKLRIGSVPYFVYYKSGQKLFEHYGILDRKAIVTVLGKP